MTSFEDILKKTGEVGYVEQMSHSVAYISGLPSAKSGEKIIFETGEIGMILDLGTEYVEALVLLDAGNPVRVGMRVGRTGEPISIPVGDSLLGRSLDALGNTTDGKGSLSDTKNVTIDANPPTVLSRSQIESTLETGVTLVDLLVPLARGQRELLVGDSKTGKTLFLLQLAINQAKKGTVCIYAAIGKKMFDVRRIAESFKGAGVTENVIVVASSASDSSGMIYLTPFTAMTIAEYFKGKGLDVLLILDDMSAHSKTYREISLLAKRFPGKNSYPGDIFFVHSRLLERAGKFKVGSITCLPVVETIMGDISGYIETNLMSITDGHMFFDIDLHNQGKRPSINPFLSVTRVGRQAQGHVLKELGTEITSFLVKFERTKEFMHFGSEMGEDARRTILQGEKITSLLNQEPNVTIPTTLGAVLLGAIWAGVWREAEVTTVKTEADRIITEYGENTDFKKRIDTFFESKKSLTEFVSGIKEQGELLFKV